MKLLIIIALVLVLAACAVSQIGTGKYSIAEGVVYREVDGQILAGDMYVPAGEGLKPAVVVVHGGGWTSRSGDMEGVSKALAEAGFVAYNITYRLAPESHHPAQMNDVSAAFEWLHANAADYNIDPQKISAWGYSAGAHLVLMAGLDRDRPPQLRSIVAGGTPAKLTAWPKSPLVFELIGKTMTEAESTWVEASPVNQVVPDSPPVFLYHGAWDKLVEPEQMEYMKGALRSKRVPVETYTADYLGHVATYFLSGTAVSKGIDFIARQAR